MLRGYTLPLSPNGTSNLVPDPPWHYVGSVIFIEYWADPDAVRSFLHPGLEPADDAGRCAAFFVEWQSCSETGGELLDPVRSQYHEFILLTSAKLDGQLVTSCPFIYVDQDISLVRGLIQGWPKQLGSVYVTRPYSLPSKAAPTLGPGGVFAGTLAVKDRRMVDATVTIEKESSAAPKLGATPIINVRHFPRLDAGHHHRPAVYELVRSKLDDVALSQVWEGTATLEFHESPQQELHLLRPVKMGKGYIYSMALTIGDLEVIRDLTGEQEKNQDFG
jgi:acetoacetate decarboxylase